MSQKERKVFIGPGVWMVAEEGKVELELPRECRYCSKGPEEFSCEDECYGCWYYDQCWSLSFDNYRYYHHRYKVNNLITIIKKLFKQDYNEDPYGGLHGLGYR